MSRMSRQAEPAATCGPPIYTTTELENPRKENPDD